MSAPGSAEWSRRMTASKVAGVLGLSKWASPYSTWLRMKGLIPSDDGRNAADKARGHYLEDGVVRWWVDQHPGVSVDATQREWVKDEWAAATPDADGELDGERFVLDVKTADDMDDWGDEPPAYYLAQLHWQMWCAEADVAYIAAIFGRPHFGFREWRVERDADLAAGIVTACRDFYDSLAADDPPPLDASTATYDVIRRQHPDIDRDAEVSLTPEQAAEFVAADLAQKAAEDRARLAKSTVLQAMGRARIAKCGSRVVARRQPHKSGVSLVRVAKTPDFTLPESEPAA